MRKSSRILIHVPHSSTVIPPEEKRYFLKEDLSDELLKMTDSYCDEIFACGHDMLVFPVSRLVCDVERFQIDDDEPMSSKGMGLAYTKCADGTPLRHVSAQKRAEIIEKYYAPHHRRFTDVVNDKLRDCDRCIIVDGHSFSPVPLPYESDSLRPDFCIGTDPFHTPNELRDFCMEYLQRCGYTVSVDRPFSGTIVPLEHLSRDSRVQSVMIEVNRRDASMSISPDVKRTLFR